MDLWNWAWNLFQQKGPGAPISFLIAGMVGMLSFLVRNIVLTQRDINKTLNNHFTEERRALEKIGEHMAATNQVLNIILDRVLDSALRPPQKDA